MCQQGIHAVRVHKYFIDVRPNPVSIINPHIIAQVQPCHQAKVVIYSTDPSSATQTDNRFVTIGFEKRDSRFVRVVYFNCFDETISFVKKTIFKDKKDEFIANINMKSIYFESLRLGICKFEVGHLSKRHNGDGKNDLGIIRSPLSVNCVINQQNRI